MLALVDLQVPVSLQAHRRHVTYHVPRNFCSLQLRLLGHISLPRERYWKVKRSIFSQMINHMMIMSRFIYPPLCYLDLITDKYDGINEAWSFDRLWWWIILERFETLKLYSIRVNWMMLLIIAFIKDATKWLVRETKKKIKK